MVWDGYSEFAIARIRYTPVRTETPGLLLREARERRGITQSELARRAGTTQSAISRIEKDRVSPTVETLRELLAMIGEKLSLETAEAAAREKPAPMKLAIHEATAADADGVLSAYEWLFEPPGRKPAGYSIAAARERLLEAIESDEAAVIIAEDDQAMVGLAAIYLTYRSVRFGQRAWVEDLAVNPDRRSQGVGAALLDAARGWAAEHGADLLGLESGEARTDAHRFYERGQPDTRSRSFGWALRPR